MALGQKQKKKSYFPSTNWVELRNLIWRPIPNSWAIHPLPVCPTTQKHFFIIHWWSHYTIWWCSLRFRSLQTSSRGFGKDMEKVNCPGKWNCGGHGVKAVPLVISPLHTLPRTKTTSEHETDCSAQSGHRAKKQPFWRAVFSQERPLPWLDVTCSHLPIFLSGAHVQPVALPEIHSEVLFLERATQPVVAQPQVLELWGWPSTQVLQIIHSIAAELQDLRGNNKHLGNELFLALPRAVWLSLCSQMGIPAPSCTRPCSLTFRVWGR